MRGLGLSVGAANLTAVAVGRAAVRRTAVLTRFGHRPPEVGVPGENPNLTERGLVITDFVDRVGDPIALLAPDGSSHRAEDLLAEALRAMVLTVAREEPEPVGVSHPAHWRPATVEALRGALSAMPEFRAPSPVLLTSDAVAALTALQQDPGVPARGVIALCDFGGRGTSITLADAARDFAPVAPAERHLDLSGDLIDQALMTHVIGELGSAGSVDRSGTSAIGSLARLRAQCRSAKERLSTAAVTALAADLPGHSGEIRLTRTELDDVIRQPLAGFISVLQELLQRSGIRTSDLVAVATVGGGARMPIVTTTLSDVLQIPVITTAHPELAAAIGAGLRAVRGTLVEGATAMAPAVADAATGLAPAAAASSAPAGPVGALAWSDADDAIPDVMPPLDEPDADSWDGDSARPRIEFAAPEEPEDEPAPWYRSPFALVAAVLVAALAAIGVVAVFLLGGEDEPASTPTTTTTTPTATSSAPAVPASEPPPAPVEPPPSEPANVNPAPPAVTVTQEAPPPPAPSEAPPPSSEAPPPPAETPPPASEQPPPSSNPPPLVPTLPYQTIPGLPFVPSPFQPSQP